MGTLAGSGGRQGAWDADLKKAPRMVVKMRPTLLSDISVKEMKLKWRRKRLVTGLRPPPGGPMAATNCVSMMVRKGHGGLRSYLQQTPQGRKRHATLAENAKRTEKASSWLAYSHSVAGLLCTALIKSRKGLVGKACTRVSCAPTIRRGPSTASAALWAAAQSTFRAAAC